MQLVVQAQQAYNDVCSPKQSLDLFGWRICDSKMHLGVGWHNCYSGFLSSKVGGSQSGLLW